MCSISSHIKLQFLHFHLCTKIRQMTRKPLSPKTLKLTESDESIVDTALDLDGNGSYVEIFDSEVYKQHFGPSNGVCVD